MQYLSRALQAILWNSRFIVLVAILASLVVSVVLFSVVTLDTSRLLGEIVHYSDPALAGAERTSMRVTIISHVASIVDGYLFGTVMIIFALGLYELFIGKIEVIENSALAARLLLIRSFDDLKDRLAKVIFLILVVLFFEHALEMPIEKPLELLYLATSVALIAGAIYLTNKEAH